MDFYNYINQDKLYEMANLNTSHTGLKEVIWVSVKNANHGPRIKVYKNKQAKGVNFSVTIEDNPKAVGEVFVNSKEFKKIQEFIILNKDNLIKYWEYELDTIDMAMNIQKV